MKNIIKLFAPLLCCFISTAQNTITIKGNIITDLKGANQIYFNYKGDPIDSTEVKNGQFKIVMPFKEGDTPWLFDEFEKKKYGGWGGYNFVFDRPGTIVIKDLDLNYGFRGKISGMKSAEEYQEFNDMNQNQQAITDELLKKYKTIPPYPSPTDTVLSPEFLAYNEDYLKLDEKFTTINLIKFVESHPDSYISTYLLGTTGTYSMDATALEKSYNTLTKSRQQSDEGKALLKFIEGSNKTKEGKYVSDFSLLTPEGKELNFSDLKGKYVVIDFWASWCGPCIATFPALKTLYKKYKNDKFEIYNISIDENKEYWLKAIAKHELPWLQAIDFKGSAKNNFAVSAVPATFLIDPTGKIIMRDGDIEKKLVEIFGY